MNPIFLKVLTFISAFIMLFTSPGGAIRQPLKTKACPEFYGSAATSKPLSGVKVPQHPYLAKEGTNGMHGNSYNTGTYNYSGPLGISPEVKSRSMNVFGGLVATLTFDSKGRIMCISGNVVGFRLLLIDADTLEILAEHVFLKGPQQLRQSRHSTSAQFQATPLAVHISTFLTVTDPLSATAKTLSRFSRLTNQVKSLSGQLSRNTT